MRLGDIIDLLGCDVVEGGPEIASREVDGCFAADLMSDVLAFSGPGALLVTGLTSIQSIQTAEIADLAGVLYVNGKRPSPVVIDLARVRGLPLLCTSLTMFAACGELYGHRIKVGAT